MTFIEFIKQLFKKEEPLLYKGCVPDERSSEEKSCDYTHEELFVAGAGELKWEEKTEYKHYPVRDQDGSLSCVAQTLAHMCGIENLNEEGRWLEFSASDIYQRRQNKPEGGMWGQDAFNIVKKHGVTLEALMPSQEMGEKAINEVKRYHSNGEVGEIFKIKKYVEITEFSMDEIARVIEMGKNGQKGVMCWFRFRNSEWNTKEPKITALPVEAHHSVTVIDYTLKGGKKYLVIQDSWGPNTGLEHGRRLISEEWLKKRMTYSAYIIDLPNNWKDNPEVPDLNKPSVLLTKDLEYGLMNDDEVRELQLVLKYEELFPQDADVTGNFLAVTKKAVQDFQTKYGIQPLGRVGPTTREFINNKYK